MRNLILLAFLLPYYVFTQNQKSEQFTQQNVPDISFDLMARFEYCHFYSPDTSVNHYLETYVNIIGHSVKYVPNEDGIPQAKIEVTQIVKQGAKIVDFKKYELSGPPLVDSIAQDIKDLQRFSLEPGRYSVELTTKDLNLKNAKERSMIQDIEVLDISRGLHFSDIELLESFVETKTPNVLSKAGYDLLPFIDNFYAPDIDKIAFYTEIYNSHKTIGKDERFILKIAIENAETLSPMIAFGGAKKLATAPVVPVIQFIDIEDLPSGRYHLKLSVINRSNETVARKKIFFQRSNNTSIEDIVDIDIQSTFVNIIDNEDTLDKFIASTRPITNDFEKRLMDKKMEGFDLKTKQQYFFNFWKNRDPQQPDDAWNRYLKEVRLVNIKYGTRIKQGFETDRGRIYLKYGAPDYIESRPNEPSSYPYEIWQYYRIAQFNNRNFIFYEPDLVTNNYNLLHSDMQGEVSNYRWKTELNRRNTPFQDIDAESGTDHYGGNSDIIFDRSR